MILIPYPKKITKREGLFYITNTTEILLDVTCDYNDFEAARPLRDEILKATGIWASIIKGICVKYKAALSCQKIDEGTLHSTICLSRTSSEKI